MSIGSAVPLKRHKSKAKSHGRLEEFELKKKGALID